MFTVERHEEQYLTYILTDSESQSRLKVVPSRGGIITAWQIEDQEIFYLDRDRFTDPQLSVRGGNPILFPICGNLPNNTYTHNNQEYTLKQHGFARDLPWDVTEQITADYAGVTVVLRSNAETLKVYPFKFEVAFTYQLQGKSLKIVQRYTNHSSEKMPVCFGFHPYFLVQDKTQLEFAIPSSSYFDQIAKKSHPYEGGFDFDAGELDLLFSSLTSNSTEIIDHQRRLRLTIEYSDLFKNLVFWTVKGKDFVCLEPWSAPRNSFNTGEQLIYLEPDSTCEALVEMVVAYF